MNLEKFDTCVLLKCAGDPILHAVATDLQESNRRTQESIITELLQRGIVTDDFDHSVYIVQLGSYYLEWSTITGSPLTRGMDASHFKDYYRLAYGNEAMKTLPDRLRRVAERGVSSMAAESIQDVVSDNRAGPNGECLSLAEIEAAYCD